MEEPVDLARLAGSGPLWGMASDDLNATLLSWAEGEGVAEQVNEERDILIVVLSGAGTLRGGGVEHDLAPQHAVLIPKGERWSVTAGADGLRYLSTHRRRDGLQIEPLRRS
ncbi:MAG TPA: AraC family ligand binding domain-containing protein [Solirubrobacteraceae bacterium]|jgi:mannose-6-phosphate isomerase-like protein (cupin superfamily)|nr:AraC family ligand binding domain-containing protein [Solirubrobacteraceae bacterium]